MNLKKIVSGLTSLALSVTAFSGIGFSGALKNSGAEAASANWKFDFGGKGASSGYTGVSASEGYDSGKGYGLRKQAALRMLMRQVRAHSATQCSLLVRTSAIHLTLICPTACIR